ncbi:hypothetical protein [Bradyrhizobium sp. CCBAU 11357]|uniref:hypothetical protein n=1 Tax=Bradyrhizobium sp. CCBAU 11357 TaxID=1630808 RepID=UPI00230467B7|nr:hypothetical protein [Bradyrhizobium sp. CCBAU 11357]MDA9497322.1 hypothetical protein [Bradyrhizobium sp. CCBAU 11357]
MVVESGDFALLSAFMSLVALLSEGDFVSAVGFFMSFEVVVGVIDSEVFDLPSAFMSPVVYPACPAHVEAPLLLTQRRV